MAIRRERRQRDVLFIGAVTLIAVACASDSNRNDSSSTSGDRVAGQSLLDRLARDGDKSLFEHKYATTLDAGSAVMFIADAGTAAVGYLCNPARGAQWFIGSRVDGEVDLTSSSGSSFKGSVLQDRLAGTLRLAGTDPYDLALESSSGATIFREPVKDGLPSGLVVFDGIIRGFVSSTTSASPSPTTSTTAGASSTDALGLRVQSDAGLLRTTIFTELDALSEAQSNIDAVESEVEQLASEIKDLRQESRTKVATILNDLNQRLEKKEADKAGDKRGVQAARAGILAVLVIAAANDIGLHLPTWVDTPLLEAIEAISGQPAVGPSTTLKATTTTSKTSTTSRTTSTSSAGGVAELRVPSFRVEPLSS